MPAYRNIRLCTKDCLCLYVCPTGAADTENSIIDVDKCIECMACVKSCISGAISIIPDRYPAQQKKADAVIAAQRALAKSKIQQLKLQKPLQLNLTVLLPDNWRKLWLSRTA